MIRPAIHSCVASLLLTMVLGCGSDQTPDAPVSDAGERIAQYDKESQRRQASPPTETWRSQFDIELEVQQQSELDQIVGKIKEKLPSAETSQIRHKAMKTGAPDHLLLVNVWFTGKLYDAEEARNYELTLIWKDDRWTPYSGSSQVIGEISKSQDAKQYDNEWVKSAIGM